MDFTKREMSIANSVAYKCAKSKPQRENIKSFLYLWMVEHFTTVQRYRFEEGGEDKLYVAMRNAHYNEMLKEKRNQRPDLFDYTHEQNKELRKKLSADMEAHTETEAVSYILGHKHKKALVEYFTTQQTVRKTAGHHGIHEQALYRAKRNAMIMAREYNPERYL
jgi:hypothetical protein